MLLAFQSLRDDFRIYHRKSWYSFDGLDGSREGVCEGEADFLVLHPDLGMLVLEVKGGRIAFDGRTGAWTSTARDGTVHGIKDPFLQAQRSVKAIAAKAAALSFEGQAMPEFVHGHAVVFPDCDFTAGAGGVSAPRELVIDAGDLARDAAGRLMEIFRLWGVRRAAAPLTRRWVKRLGQHVLAPHFSLGLALGSALGWEEKAPRWAVSCAGGPGWRGTSRRRTTWRRRRPSGTRRRASSSSRPRRSWESGSTRWWWTRRRTS
ncbi:MAG: nuclease-related domain-containing protein [Thermoanaerobaculia bacterium]